MAADRATAARCDTPTTHTGATSFCSTNTSTATAAVAAGPAIRPAGPPWSSGYWTNSSAVRTPKRQHRIFPHSPLHQHKENASEAVTAFSSEPEKPASSAKLYSISSTGVVLRPRSSDFRSLRQWHADRLGWPSYYWLRPPSPTPVAFG